jgi:hypothetical protein
MQEASTYPQDQKRVRYPSRVQRRRSSRRAACHGVAAALILLSASPLASQDASRTGQEPDIASSREDAPFVYLDCRRCDDSHIRREITFVNYVREPDLAQVHVLVTDQATGSGGRMFTLAFLGRREFAGFEHTLQYNSPQSNSAAQEREGLTHMLSLGLVPYVARTPVARQLRLTVAESLAPQLPSMADPWNNWTMEVYGGGNLSMESTQRSWNARYGFYANRVTEEWKIRLRPYFNNNARLIRRKDREDVRISHRRHGFDSFVIKSLGEHWGAGIFADYITTTIDNLAHKVTVTPAVEYSLYPYSEASRRQVTVAYRVGYEFADYITETIFEKTREHLFGHVLSTSVQYRQPWGSVSSGLTGLQYFHDASLYRLIFDGNLSLRVGRGVSLNLGGSYQRINDQLSLPRGDASLEDILLERRRLATSYRGSGTLGLSYTFGSIFSNVVNPRF